MTERDFARQAAVILSELYPDWREAKRIAYEAGLHDVVRRMSPYFRISERWSFIVDSSLMRKTFEELLRIVSDEYPGNPQVTDLVRAYRELDQGSKIDFVKQFRVPEINQETIEVEIQYNLAGTMVFYPARDNNTLNTPRLTLRFGSFFIEIYAGRHQQNLAFISQQHQSYWRTALGFHEADLTAIVTILGSIALTSSIINLLGVHQTAAIQFFIAAFSLSVSALLLRSYLRREQ